jgi:uncharacterized protein involved in exopolysaccharide biosynthesis
MSEKSQDQEISLIDLFAVLWRHKKMILAVVITAIVGVLAFSLLSRQMPPEISPLPNVYKPQALMLINEQSSQGGGSGLSSMLNNSGGSLSSLAGLIGINAAGQTYSQLAVYLTTTNTMLDAVTDEFDLITRYKIKKFPRAASRKKLKKLLLAEFDDKSGVLSVSFTDRDPEFAQRVVNFSAAYLERRFNELGVDKNKIEKDNLEVNVANTFAEIQKLEEEGRRLEQSLGSGYTAGHLPSVTLELNRITLELEAQKQVYTQLKIQYEILKVTMASEKPVFQILELAETPDQKSGPGRGLICIIVTFGAAFFACFLAFFLNAVDDIKKDPAAMAKLRGDGE